MARKTDAYVDTAAFIAFLDRSDSHHPHFKRLFSDPPKLLTSSLVIAEGHGWFLRRYDQRRAVEFLNFIDAIDVLDVIGFDAGELRRAGRVVRKYDDQSLTLADAHGIAVMQAKKITTCWSSDRHLTLGGATLAI